LNLRLPLAALVMWRPRWQDQNIHNSGDRQRKPAFRIAVVLILMVCCRIRAGSLSRAAISAQHGRSWCTVLRIYDWQIWW